MKVFPTAMAEFFLEGVPPHELQRMFPQTIGARDRCKKLVSPLRKHTLVYMFQISLIDILTSLVKMQE
jgi:hypothetical protein